MSFQGKKFQDVPLRKSERRQLRQRAGEILLLRPLLPEEDGEHRATSGTAGSRTTPDAPLERKGSTDAASVTATATAHSLLDDVFLRGSLIRRTATRSSSSSSSSSGGGGGKIHLYYRSPAASETTDDTHLSLDRWPYTATPQCVWIETDHNDDGCSGVPTVALVSALPPESIVLTTVHIAAAASRYICRGADVMWAGVIRVVGKSDAPPSPSLSPPSLRANPLLASSPSLIPALVAVIGNPQPFAVGWMQNVTDCSSNPRRGVAVHVASSYGDDLWKQQHSQLLLQQPTATQQSKSVGTWTSLAKSCHGNTNPWGGGNPYRDGHYGNAGFRDGVQVLPIINNTGKEEEEDGDEDDDYADDNGESNPIATRVEVEEGLSPSNPGPADDEAAGTPEEEGIPTPDVLPAMNASLDSDSTPLPSTPVTHLTAAAPTEKGSTEPPPPSPSPPVQSPDDVLHRAVCRALVHLSKSDFPLPSATFYAAHVLPHRDSDTTINLKHTSWKKFSTYLLHQVERGLVTVEADPTKKDLAAKLTGCDRRHVDLREFLDERRAEVEASSDAAKHPTTKTVLVDLYAVPKPVASLLRLDDDAVSAATATSAERRGTGLLTLQEARRILDDYIVRETLVPPTRPNVVLLDGPLTTILYPPRQQKKGGTNPTESPPPPPPPTPESLTRKELVAVWLLCLNRGFALVESPGNRIVKMGRGSPPTIVLEVSRRQSNKFVTTVTGLSGFGIDPHVFAKDAATRFACSTSVEVGEFGSVAQKAAATVVLIQGHVTKELEALLLGDERLCDHGGVKDSPYRVPKGVVVVQLKKGVPTKKNKKY